MTQLIQTEGLIALSLQGGKADSSDALVKGSGDWDIFGTDEEESYSDSPFED